MTSFAAGTPMPYLDFLVMTSRGSKAENLRLPLRCDAIIHEKPRQAR